MNRDIVQPFRGKGEPRLPRRGVLAVNPSDVRWIKEIADRLKLIRFFLFNSSLYVNDNLFLAGPAVGAPMAVLTLEKLIALGAEEIILYGWCGSLIPRLCIGDILLPTWAHSEEGTSRHYGAPATIAADADLQKVVRSCLEKNTLLFQEGPVWTTDAPYRENRDKVEQYGREGLVAVDMEYSALCAVSSFRGVHCGGLLLVSDELWQKRWQPRFSNKEFQKRSGMLLDHLCNSL